MSRASGPSQLGPAGRAEGVAILVDFDGTAASRDVGGAVLERFARDPSWKVIDDDYEKGRVGSRAAYRILERLLEGSPEEWVRFALGTARLDPGLPALAGVAAARGWRLEILSDGLGFYIYALLEREGLTLPVRSNELVVLGGRTRILTPYLSSLCGRCGTCKAERIESLVGEGYRVVYVGDGFSDLCAGPRAHRLFAKAVLARHCVEKGFPFEPFDTLEDVARALSLGQTGH